MQELSQENRYRGRKYCGVYMSKYLYHTACPECRRNGRDHKGNNMAVYEDNSTYCFACGYSEQPDIKEKEYYKMEQKEKKDKKEKRPLIEAVSYQNLRARGINEEVCRLYNYGIGEYNGEPCQIAAMYDDKGQVVAQKLRFKDKKFIMLGDNSKALMFGQQLFKGENSRQLVITEGEIDCLTISQLWENKYPVVSVKNGAGGAKNDILANIEWLEGFDKVIFAFDMDEVGRKAAYECAELLSPHKAYIAHLPAKDANEAYQKNLGQQLIKSLWEARQYSPDYIKTGSDLKEVCRTPRDKGLSIPFPDLNNKIDGIRQGELVLFTAGSGVGKSTLIHEIAYYLHVEHKLPVGLICLEESVKTTGQRWISIAMNKNLLKSGTVFDEEEYERAYQKALSDNVYIYDHFGSQDTKVLLPKIKAMIKGLGCKIIVLDHISIVVSGLDEKESGSDERKTIDMFMTQLRSLCEETGVTILAINHLKRSSAKSYNEGSQVSLTDLRGSGALEQLSDIVIALERNQQDKEKSNISQIRILKNRPTGICGESDMLIYSRETGRLLAYNGEDTNTIPDFNADNNKERLDDVSF